MPPARTTVISGRRPAAAATNAVSSLRPRRSSAAGGSPEPTMMPLTSASSRSVVMTSGSIVSTLPETTSQPLRDAVATSGASARSDAATTAIVRGRWLLTSSRGRSMALPRRSSSAAASPGSAATARSPKARTTASTSAPAGIDSDPMRRQRAPTRPISAAAMVAAPISRARTARGSLVTGACYPPQPWRGSDRLRATTTRGRAFVAAGSPCPLARSLRPSLTDTGAGAGRLRRPRRPLRRSPRAGRSEARCRRRRRGSRWPTRARHRTGRGGPGRRTASRWHRARDTAGSPRGNGPPARSTPEAGSLGRPARPAHRAAPRSLRTGRSPRSSADRLVGGVERRAERLISGRPAQGEHDVVDHRAGGQLVADGVDRDPCRLLEREPADARAKRGERDAAGADLTGASHRAAHRRLDDRAAGPPVAIEGDGVDDVLGGKRAGRRHDRAAERDGSLADGREFDRIAARPLERAADAGRHPERQIRRVHDRVDLQVADIAIPELDARQGRQPQGSVSVRRPTGPAAAWYTRGSRRDIATTTSQEFVVRSGARSRTSRRSLPELPRRTNSSIVPTGAPGTSVTSAITECIVTLPNSGTPLPRNMV